MNNYRIKLKTSTTISLISVPKTTTESRWICPNNRHSKPVQSTRTRISFTSEASIKGTLLWVGSWLTVTVNRIPFYWAWSLVMRPLFRCTHWTYLGLGWFGVRHVVRMIGVSTQAASWTVALSWSKRSSLWTTAFWRSRVKLRAIISSAEAGFLEFFIELQRAQGLISTGRWTGNCLMSCWFLWCC